MARLALVAAALLLSAATTDPFMLGDTDARPGALAPSISGICYRDGMCRELHDQARRALVAEYGRASPKRRALIAATLTRETKGDQIDWQGAANDLSIDFATSPSRGAHCTSRATEGGRDVVTDCE